MQKVRIIEAGNELGLGGTEYTIQLFSKYLNPDLFTVQVVGLHKGGERAELIRQLGITVHLLEGDYTRLGQLLDETDVIHWHGDGTMHPSLVATLTAHRPKMIIQTNIFGSYDHSPFYNLIDYDLYVSQMILIRRMWYDRDLGINFNAKRKVLPNPVDIQQIRKQLPSAAEIDAFKIKHQLRDAFIVGRVGRADDAKFDLITLDAFALFSAQHPQARFLLVGATTRMLRHARALGIYHKVIVCENTPDLHQLLIYYQSISIFLAASAMGESFGMVMAEAMAAGTPVITISTEDRDNAQVEVVDNLVTGLVVAPRADQLAAALHFLFENPQLRAGLSAASQEKSTVAYNAKKVAQSLSNLIFKHLAIPLHYPEGNLITDYSEQMVNDYHYRCTHLWEPSSTNPSK